MTTWLILSVKILAYETPTFAKASGAASTNHARSHLINGRDGPLGHPFPLARPAVAPYQTVASCIYEMACKTNQSLQAFAAEFRQAAF
jgi:hypothetical protein